MQSRVEQALTRLESALARLEAKAAAAPERGEEIAAIRGMIGEAISLIGAGQSPTAGQQSPQQPHGGNGGQG